MTEKKLDELKNGEKGKITKITGNGSFFRRLLDLGVVKGAEVEMMGVAPLGDPIEIKIKGYNLSLRKSEANWITVEVQQNDE
ncbi:MAG: ferrous iron transport protein A [Dehalococcoidales bacterium]